MSLTTWLISYYKFDEWSWTTAFDSVGSNDGTLISSSFTSWKINNSVQFNSTTARIEYWDYWVRTTNSNWIAFACWIYKTESWRTFVIDQSETNANWVWSFGVNATSRTLTFRRWGVSGGAFIQDSSIQISNNSWQFIWFSFEWWTCKFFINNSIENISSGSSSWALRWGKNAIWNRLLFWTWSDWLNWWKIDEAWIWNRELTNTEITELWNSWNWLQYPFTSESSAWFILKNF